MSPRPKQELSQLVPRQVPQKRKLTRTSILANLLIRTNPVAAVSIRDKDFVTAVEGNATKRAVKFVAGGQPDQETPVEYVDT